ncbi:DUF4232 domain-containing protein [Streptomyces sp. GMY02]|uniref:DUF4232 domain-containing protein n=1 Tax=Streptomyces sp. GMY02 TaxID=1333528 RepID=UPI001C2BF368|nr:DUF4232 domain-containing protein [Streptomyces sp. GMY02]QXE35417.1 DUF4232 domain-containing protein [Streptomyces sp. GMY02]
MTHPRGITALLFCLLAALTAVACDVTPPPDDDTVVAPAPRSSAPPHTAVTPSAAPVTRSAVPTRTARRSATPAPSASPTRSTVSPSPAVVSGGQMENGCAARDLVLTSDKPRKAVLGNPGDVAMDVRLRNRSGIRCVLDGWPGVVFIGGEEIPITCMPSYPGPQCLGRIDTTTRRPLSVTRYGPGRPTAVRLAPGQSTPFSIVWKSATATVCNGADFYYPPYAADIWVPDDSTPLVLTWPRISPCHGKIGITPFGVTG